MGIAGHNFIALSSDEYNRKNDTVLAVALTSKDSTTGKYYNCVVNLEPGDVESTSRLERSFVRCDCVCRVHRKHITRVETMVVSKDCLRKIWQRASDFSVKGL